MEWIVIGLIYSIVFGIATQYVNESKGYYGGFWWGFLLGFIGLIAIACKPVRKTENSDVRSWICIKCGRQNAYYITTCLCGLKKSENSGTKKESSRTTSAADELLKYKNLLDVGAITQEEYDQKKKQLLGI